MPTTVPSTIIIKQMAHNLPDNAAMKTSSSTLTMQHCLKFCTYQAIEFLNLYKDQQFDLDLYYVTWK